VAVPRRYRMGNSGSYMVSAGAEGRGVMDGASAPPSDTSYLSLSA
jgi:hypothetical protein